MDIIEAIYNLREQIRKGHESGIALAGAVGEDIRDLRKQVATLEEKVAHLENLNGVNDV